jgi:hypothetical protein
VCVCVCVCVCGRCQLSGTYLATSANCADRYVRIWNWAKRNDCLHVLKPQVEIELEGHDEKVVLCPTKRGVRVSSIVDIGKVGVCACFAFAAGWGGLHSAIDSARERDGELCLGRQRLSRLYLLDFLFPVLNCCCDWRCVHRVFACVGCL